MKIVIIGIGLIGGSIAKGFKKYTDFEVAGYDKDEDVLKKALSENSIDSIFSGDFTGCDIIISGLFPEATLDFLRENAEKIPKDAIVTDCGGVKDYVCTEAFHIAKEYGFTFIGMHPMAGKEKFGYSSSTPDLFLGASLILTPSMDTPEEKCNRLWRAMEKIGFARLRLSTPKEHDRVIAYTSQLAHVVSSAYIKSPTAMRHTGFSAGSFRDMTRVAHLNEKMWTELFMDNRDNLAKEVDSLIERLNEYSDALKSGDMEKLFELLKDGREKKDLSDELCGKEKE